MAGDWIKIRTDLPDDPAVIAISQALNLSQNEVVGLLIRLWSWADRHTSTGYVRGVSFEWIDDFLCAQGLAKRLEVVGWLSSEKHGVRFPHFGRHNGTTAKRRASESRRQKELRDARTQNVRKTYALDAVKAPSREEKRREDNNSPPYSPPSGGRATPSSSRREASTTWPDEAVDRIFQAYPKKVGKPPAMGAIRKALATVAARMPGIDPTDWLMAKVQTYALARDGEDPKFTPNPATWFNENRFDDDPRPVRLGTGPVQAPPGKYAQHGGKP